MPLTESIQGDSLNYSVEGSYTCRLSSGSWVSPAAIFERRLGVEVFGEGLLAVVMLHEGLRSVGMVHDGPRPVVHDILPAADSRPGKA